MNRSQLYFSIITQPKPLSDQQKAAVGSRSPYLRIIAGAGAGKTETLTRKIVYLLLVEEVEPSSIVAFTYTDKAAQSMKSRIFQRVKEQGGLDLCAKLGEMFIGTIHAFCAHLLEDYFGYGNYGTLDANQEMAFLLRVGWDIHRTGINHSQWCKQFIENLNVVYGEMIPDEILKRKASNLHNHFHKYEKFLNDYQMLTFNRMIHLANRNIEENPKVVEKIEYLIVDEYQDINKAQELLISNIGQNAQIFIVGDPRQTIYQWRGSDETCFDRFVEIYKSVEEISISENRRSCVSIVEISNKFARNFTKSYSPLVPIRKELGGSYQVQFDSDTEEASWIADQIEQYIQLGKCSYGDIGILFRSVTASAPVFIDEFRRRGIPFIVGGKVGLFRRTEVQAVGKLYAWLSNRGFFNMNQWSSRDRIISEDLLNSGLTDWQDATHITPNSQLIETLQEWREQVKSNKFDNFTEAYFALLQYLGYHSLNSDDPEHVVIMANLGRFGQFLTDFETSIRLGGKKKNWDTDIYNLCWFMNTYANTSYEEQAGDDIRGIDAVQLMTIHQSKGLEWPLVFLPSVVFNRFPPKSMGRRKDWFFDETAFQDLFDITKYHGGFESERKLLYVALTRAKDCLVLSSYSPTTGRNREMSPLLTEGDWSTHLQDILPDEQLPIHDLSSTSIEDELQTYSAGELILYGKCPYKYRLNKLWGYNPGLSDYLGYGRALHHCLRLAGDIMKEEKCGALTAVKTAMEREFFMPFMPEKRMNDIKHAAAQHLFRFVTKYADDMMRIRDVESRIEFPVQNAMVAGKVDVILHDNDAIEVREYKSSEGSATPEEISVQVKLYSRGLTALGETVSKGSVAFLEESRMSDVDVSSESITRTVNMIEGFIEGIGAKKFPACPGGHCDKCDYRIICRWAS